MALRTHREAAAIVVLGSLVALAPIVWFGIVWPGETDLMGDGVGGAVYGLIFVLPPFVMLAVFRGAGMVTRAGMLVALLLGGSVVVLMQVATLDPHGQSSTQEVGWIFATVYGCLVVAGVAALDGIVAGLRRRFRPG